MGRVEWGVRWVERPDGVLDRWGGFRWDKINLLRGIFVLSSSGIG